jgi:hypothetical protein
MSDEVHFLLGLKFMSASRRHVICSHFGSVFVVYIFPLSKAELKRHYFQKEVLRSIVLKLLYCMICQYSEHLLNM